MKIDSRKTERPQFLSGWKEISNYLGKGVRTVQRYERELGLPVRRPAAKDRGSVVATKDEIDAWVHASPIRDAFRLTRTEAYPRPDTVALKRGLATMSGLRDQMLQLRTELRDSMQRLEQSLIALQGDLKGSLQPEPQGTSLLPSETRRDILHLLELDPRRKAS